MFPVILYILNGNIQKLRWQAKGRERDYSKYKRNYIKLSGKKLETKRPLDP